PPTPPAGETQASLVNTLTATHYAATLTGHRSTVSSVAFAPDGRTLATSSDDRTVILWDLADRARPRRLGTPLTDQDAVTSVAFSPDGRWLATGSSDRTVILWDLADRARPRRLGTPLKGPRDVGTSGAFARDARTLAAGGGRGVILWDLTDRARPRRLGTPLTDQDAVPSGAFRPDGPWRGTRPSDA